MLIDTHCHLYLERFDHDREALFARARQAGVERFYLPNIDRESLPALKALAAARPDCYPMLGIHPSSVKEDWEQEWARLEPELDSETPYCAVGEIGLDLYWEKRHLEAQIAAFRCQMAAAFRRGLPIVIHCREAFDPLIPLLQEEAEAYGNDWPTRPGIFHCFTGNQAQAQAIVALGFKLGIGGVVTFKNGGLDQSLRGLQLSDCVLETDAPFLAPVPFRGKRNEPAYLPYIVEKMAQIFDCSTESVIASTGRSALELFQHDK